MPRAPSTAATKKRQTKKKKQPANRTNKTQENNNLKKWEVQRASSRLALLERQNPPVWQLHVATRATPRRYCVQKSERAREKSRSACEMSVCKRLAARRWRRRSVSPVDARNATKEPETENAPNTKKQLRVTWTTNKQSFSAAEWKTPWPFLCCRASDAMSNACRTASAREKSRERVTTIAARQPLRGGQQAEAFQVAKLAEQQVQERSIENAWPQLQPVDLWEEGREKYSRSRSWHRIRASFSNLPPPAVALKKQPEREPGKQRKEDNPEASASSQQSFSAAESKSTSGLLMLQRERRHFECVQNSECKTEVAICVSAMSVCERPAPRRGRRQSVSRRRSQPKNVATETKEGTNKDGSSTIQQSCQRCWVKDPLTFLSSSASDTMSNVVQEQRVHERSLNKSWPSLQPADLWARATGTITSGCEVGLHFGLRPPAFDLRPSAFGLRPSASAFGLRPPAFKQFDTAVKVDTIWFYC